MPKSGSNTSPPPFLVLADEFRRIVKPIKMGYWSILSGKRRNIITTDDSIAPPTVTICGRFAKINKPIRMKNKKGTMVIVLALVFFAVQAQNTVPATGGNATGSGGVLSYTVGQVAYTVDVGAGGSVSKGINQTFEISIVTKNKKFKGVFLSASVYPNPTIDFLTLDVKDIELSDLLFRLYDIEGRLLMEKNITESQTHIRMTDYKPANYIMKVIKMQGHTSQQEVITFKIIKQ